MPKDGVCIYRKCLQTIWIEHLIHSIINKNKDRVIQQVVSKLVPS